MSQRNRIRFTAILPPTTRIFLLLVTLVVIGSGSNETYGAGNEKSCTVIIRDIGFENGAPSTAWKERSSDNASPICYNPVPGYVECHAPVFDFNVPFANPHSGSHWAVLGGVEGHGYEASLTQRICLPKTDVMYRRVYLTFYLWLQGAAHNERDTFKVLIDGQKVYKAKGNANISHNDYVQIRKNITEFADGGQHTLKIVGSTTGLNENGEADFFAFNVDDVNIEYTE